MSPSLRPRMPHRALAALAFLWVGTAGAADLFVLDATLERPDAPTLNPTFMATPGERSLLVLDGERPVDIAMTVQPADGDAGPYDVRVELIENGEILEETVSAVPGEPTRVTLGDSELTVRLNEQSGLQQGPDALEPEPGNAGRVADPAGATVGTGATGQTDADEPSGSD